MEGGEGVPHSSHLAEDQPSISHHLVCKAMARNITGEEGMTARCTADW